MPINPSNSSKNPIEQIKTAIACLSNKQRQAIAFRLQNKSYQEIARLMVNYTISPSAVRNLVYYGKLKMKPLLSGVSIDQITYKEVIELFNPIKNERSI